MNAQIGNNAQMDKRSQASDFLPRISRVMLLV